MYECVYVCACVYVTIKKPCKMDDNTNTCHRATVAMEEKLVVPVSCVCVCVCTRQRRHLCVISGAPANDRFPASFFPLTHRSLSQPPTATTRTRQPSATTTSTSMYYATLRVYLYINDRHIDFTQVVSLKTDNDPVNSRHVLDDRLHY